MVIEIRTYTSVEYYSNSCKEQRDSDCARYGKASNVFTESYREEHGCWKCEYEYVFSQK